MDIAESRPTAHPTHVQRDDEPKSFALKPDKQHEKERVAPSKMGSGTGRSSSSSSRSSSDEDMSMSVQSSSSSARRPTTGIGAPRRTEQAHNYPENWNILPHPKDVGRDFLISLPHLDSPAVAKYLGHDGKNHIFSYHGKDRAVPNEDIHGYRPTVGRSFPRGMEPRSDDDRLSDRSHMMLSSGDLSEPLARQRKDPSSVDRMATTTFEPTPDYASYAPNREQLSRLGVPILNNMNLSKPEDVRRMQQLPDDAHVHFQMPRVPQGTKGYSTQQLIRDTASIPKTLDKPDMEISITAPVPTHYASVGVHNRIYGLENQNALKNTDRQVQSKNRDDLSEAYGYSHRQTTVDDSTAAAENRMTYTLEKKPDKDDSMTS